MKIVRFDHAGQSRYGFLEEGEVEVLSAAPWLGGQPVGERLPLQGLTLLAPCEPTKIVCIGRNYAAHAKELGNEVPPAPLIFIKPASSVIGPGQPIVIPSISENVQHEAELAVVIGRRARRISAAEVPEYVAGFTCLNDVTARDIQRAETHFTRAKGFDTFCPIGPWLAAGWSEPSGRSIRCLVGGEVKQDGNTRDLITGVADLVAFVSRVMTLEPGDVISTGTPAGVGPLAAGEVVHVEIEGVGRLTNPVINED